MSTKTKRAPAKPAKPSKNGVGSRPRFEFSEDMISKPVKASTIEYATRRVSQHYAPLIQKVSSLKVGEALEITPPSGVDLKRFRQSTFATLVKRLKPHLGKNRLRSGISKEGNLVIKMVSGKGE